MKEYPAIFNNTGGKIMEYSERIRALREDNDLTQEYIAKILHVAQNTYSGYEKGHREMPANYLICLAKFYDVDMNYILGISDIKNKYPVK